MLKPKLWPSPAQHIWVYSMYAPMVVEDWVERAREHSQAGDPRYASRYCRLHIDPQCAYESCSRVWRYRVNLEYALGFGLQGWCPKCTNIDNRIGWNSFKMSPPERAKASITHLYGTQYLFRRAAELRYPGQGQKVDQNGRPIVYESVVCRLCQRNEFYAMCMTCERGFCHECLIGHPDDKRERPPKRCKSCWNKSCLEIYGRVGCPRSFRLSDWD